MKKILFALFLSTISLCPAAFAQDTDYLLTIKDGKVGFNLDSTLHMVRGNAKKFEGLFKVPHPWEPGRLSVEIKVAVKEMDTDHESRDEKMRNYCLVMEEHPEIHFKSTEFRGFSITSKEKGLYGFVIDGDLTIKGISKKVSIPVEVTVKDAGVRFYGKVMLNYLKDFNIKNPSVFIFRVAKEVEVFFDMELPHLPFEKIEPAFQSQTSSSQDNES